MTKFIDEILYSNVPYGVKIGKNEYGFGLFAEREFNIGDRMWFSIECKISDKDLPQKIPLITNQGEFVLDKHVHQGLLKDHVLGIAAIAGFDSFSNHSCDANSYGVILKDDFDCVFASKKIEIGDEITCNYNAFDYECDYGINDCLCGSQNCAKKIAGFKHLHLDSKLQLLATDHVCAYVIERWEEEENIIVVDDLMCPDHVEITKNNFGFTIASKKIFDTGDLIYSTNAKAVNPQNQKIVANVNGHYLVLDNEKHVMQPDDCAVFSYFDSFMNYSCNPNVHKRYIRNKTYVYATKNIHIGEELTMKCKNKLHNNEKYVNVVNKTEKRDNLKTNLQ